MITDHITPDPAVPAFVAKAPTRAAGTFLAVETPEEFFAAPRHLTSLTRALGGRFARRQTFYDRRDVAQDAAVVVLEAARRWTPGHGVPFGVYAYRSALQWCTGAMLRASIPVTGCESRAATEGVRYTSLDATTPGADGAGTTYGERLDAAKVVGASTLRPDDRMQTEELLHDLRAATADLSDEVFDAVAAVMSGTKVPAAEIPAGWTEATLTRLAERVRAELQGRVGARVDHTPAPTAAPAYNPWG